ncbi:MAG: hypothetical protein H7239_11630 [Flavobacterium sp.]|nr:hypothetical protein [Flavobacterium sp.]
MNLINFIEIENNSNIIKNIEFESIETYNFLKNEFIKTNVKENYLFQFVYRSFYRLDNAGLKQEFKVKYFEIFEEIRSQENINVKTILLELYQFPCVNPKIINSFQFSFTTKMLNMIDNNIPIYDSKVENVFNWKRFNENDFNMKFEFYSKRLNTIKETYNEIIEKKLLPKTMSEFDIKFKNHNLSDIKKLDFIIWSFGKIKNNN